MWPETAEEDWIAPFVPEGLTTKANQGIAFDQGIAFEEGVRG